MSLEIWNRRYTGSKYKLTEWIKELIEQNCSGNSFCDIFAGTGVVAATVLDKFNRIIINDFLYSNNVIYTAFFDSQPYDIEKLTKLTNKWLSVEKYDIPENFIGTNYGNRYFSANDAKLIGFIRNKIEEYKSDLSHREYCILIASLLYSADKIANTVGHYDAYIKGKNIEDKFHFNFIKPYITQGKEIEIYRQDANQLAKTLNCDIVYIDPPYNSRQYSRFYHVLETIVQNDDPELTGAALKRPTENMSDYCRASATNVFKELIHSLNCSYIVVSYNNTYNSKSSSSRNKIEFDSIVNILKSKGQLKIFEKKHQFFNAGKTDFDDHKEYIFIVKVN